jgi:hypothetical protein
MIKNNIVVLLNWSICSNKTFSCKQNGNDCVIDLSAAKPGEIPGTLFVVKMSGVL